MSLDFTKEMRRITAQNLRSLAAQMLAAVGRITPSGNAEYDRGFQAGARFICEAIDGGAEDLLLERKR